jgi:hypothetical protein
MFLRLAAGCSVWSSVPRRSGVVEGLSFGRVPAGSRRQRPGWLCEGVWLAGHGGEGGGDFLEVGFDVGGGCGSGGVGVAGVGAGDAVAEVPFDPGQCGVAEPVGGDALGGDPGESFAESFPVVVVAAAGEWLAGAEPE